MEENKDALQDPQGQGPDDEDPNKDLDSGEVPEDKGEQGGQGEEKGKEEDIQALLEARDKEIQELRKLLRENRQELNSLHETVEGSMETMDKAGLIPEEDKEAAAREEALVAQRERELDVILEMTRLNPKYEDVDEVVSQSNFDKAIDNLAQDYSRVNAVPMEEARQAVEGWVWMKTNPYRFMYDYIKGMQKGDDKVKTPRKPAEAPSSVQNLSGGSGGSGNWTAAKIDSLSEEKLMTVPKDVYEAYLRGELK